MRQNEDVGIGDPQLLTGYQDDHRTVPGKQSTEVLSAEPQRHGLLQKNNVALYKIFHFSSSKRSSIHVEGNDPQPCLEESIV